MIAELCLVKIYDLSSKQVCAIVIQSQAYNSYYTLMNLIQPKCRRDDLAYLFTNKKTINFFLFLTCIFAFQSSLSCSHSEFVILGLATIYKLWANRPDDCSPFDEYGCPAWYCDNRMFGFALIFYSTSLALLSPVWFLIIAFISWTIYKGVSKPSHR